MVFRVHSRCVPKNQPHPKKELQIVWIELAKQHKPRFWQRSFGIPAGGVNRNEFEPILESIFVHSLGEVAWESLGAHWSANKKAFQEMDEHSPDGIEALARFCTRHFLRQLPAEGITQTVFWDAFMLYHLQTDHGLANDDETFRDYLRERIMKPDWLEFLKRFTKALDGNEKPELRFRVQLCFSWDLFPMPLRYWADSAIVDLFSSSYIAANLDRVRNTRRELGLRRRDPIIVREYRRKPGSSSNKSTISIKIDDEAAARTGMRKTLKAFLQFLKAPENVYSKLRL